VSGQRLYPTASGKTERYSRDRALAARPRSAVVSWRSCLFKSPRDRCFQLWQERQTVHWLTRQSNSLASGCAKLIHNRFAFCNRTSPIPFFLLNWKLTHHPTHGDFNENTRLCRQNESFVLSPGFPRGIAGIEKVLNREIGFEDLEKILNLAKVYVKY